MKITDSLLKEAGLLVKDFVAHNSFNDASCGCFGCGLGCSGTVGMD